jgi:hypothetical protein
MKGLTKSKYGEAKEYLPNADQKEVEERGSSIRNEGGS